MGRAVSTRMRLRTAQLSAAVTIFLAISSIAGAQARKKKPVAQPAPLPCGDLVGFQVLLDRQNFSTGEIDGKPGANFSRALSAFQTARQLTPGSPDCPTWEALGGAEATLTTYTITDADVQGPFEKTIPPQLANQAKLATLNYRSPTELIAERFHASPALLAQLNRGVAMTAGQEIKCPRLRRSIRRPGRSLIAAVNDVRIEVSKAESALRATRADGTLVFYAPVSSGSLHDPLPPGDFKVRGVAWRPPFHYNPRAVLGREAG